MLQQLEAVFEDGVLRPLGQLVLAEKQHVLLTVADFPPEAKSSEWQAEQEWIRVHGEEYCGQWVALRGGELLSHGPDARAVRDEARAKGVYLPLLCTYRKIRDSHRKIRDSLQPRPPAPAGWNDYVPPTPDKLSLQPFGNKWGH
jgi:predicted DNA-binding antitoxin AbrB/MazE fold protein